MKRIVGFLAVSICLLFCIHTITYADSINLPAGLVEIKEEAFYGDTNITEVTIPEGTTTIGPRAFAYSGLQKINLPKSVNSIDSTAFDGLSDNFVIVAPRDSYSYQYAVNNTYNWQDPSGIEYNDFMLWMLEQYDANENGVFDEAEIEQVTDITCGGMGFTSLEGIEIFYNLESLYCPGNNLTSLDVSHNLKLETLYTAIISSGGFIGNPLTHLDVSNNPALKFLSCSNCNLTELDVSHNPLLRILSCFQNKISDLDVSKNPLLSNLGCGSNPLGSLDVSKNPKLYELYCFANQLSYLDVSNNPELRILMCTYNQLVSIDVSHCASGITVQADDNVTIIR